MAGMERWRKTRLTPDEILTDTCGVNGAALRHAQTAP